PAVPGMDDLIKTIRETPLFSGIHTFFVQYPPGHIPAILESFQISRIRYSCQLSSYVVLIFNFSVFTFIVLRDSYNFSVERIKLNNGRSFFMDKTFLQRHSFRGIFRLSFSENLIKRTINGIILVKMMYFPGRR